MVAAATRRPPRAKKPNRPPRPKRRSRKLVAVDTETTGLDIRHGCRPFFVGTVDEDGTAYSWEWEVDPYTRLPSIPEGDARELSLYLKGKRLVFHNTGFDVAALASIGVDVPSLVSWDHIEDTLIGSHVLDSEEDHGLKELALKYLDILDDDQQDLREAVNSARTYGRREDFAIGRIGLKTMPGLNQAPNAGWWVVDMWLPRAVAVHRNDRPSHKWWGVCARYGLMDPVRTLGMYFLQREGLREEGLERLYEIRKKLLPIVYNMSNAGVPVSPTRHKKLLARFEQLEVDHEERAKANAPVMVEPGGGDYSERIDNLNSGPQVVQALYGPPDRMDASKRVGYELPILKTTGNSSEAWPEGNPSSDKDTLAALLLEVDPLSREYRFIENLQLYRKCSKLRGYLDSYQRYGKLRRHRYLDRLVKYYLLHTSFNVTGTATTRWSSYWPNVQNISKQDDYNLRYAFGPLPGREWLSLDYENIELRIFAYESGDKDLIRAFESGRSVHMVIAEVLRPDEVRRLGEDAFKKTDAYRWTKNGNFSLIYGASPRKADATYRVKGAYQAIRERFRKIDEFMEAKDSEAKARGYITTLGGYRLVVPRGKPHVAVNYFVQGSAGWFITEAVIKVYQELQDHPEWDTRLIMQVHDELDLDTPAPAEASVGLRVKDLMEESGKTYGVPSPVDLTVVRSNWSEDEPLKIAA